MTNYNASGGFRILAAYDIFKAQFKVEKVPQ